MNFFRIQTINLCNHSINAVSFFFFFGADIQQKEKITAATTTITITITVIIIKNEYYIRKTDKNRRKQFRYLLVLSSEKKAKQISANRPNTKKKKRNMIVKYS